ncbi:GNAT family N-acetyltransferase [Mycoplasmatota bacterium zrk1]
MKFNLDKVQNGLLDFRRIRLIDEVNGIYYILRENYSKEAYYFKMDGLEFITYGKEVEDIVKGENFDDNFEEKCDYEFALDKSNFRPVINDNYKYRLLDKSDSLMVSDFKDKCTKGDLDQGQVSIDDPLVMGTFKNDNLIGIASFWEWKNDLNDIGVLIDSNYRGMNVGPSLVSRLIKEVINDKICIYRADYENIGSIRVAEKIGFRVVSKIHRLRAR